MKKTISFVLAFILLFACLSFPSVAQDVTTDITGVSMQIGKDITVNYTATLASGDEAAKMKFTMNGKETLVDGVKSANGVYVYAFKGVSPQCMGDTVKAELVLGDTVLVSKDGYSVRAYCDKLLASTSNSLGLSREAFASLKTLIADMLEYGAMSQIYQDYKTDALVNEGIEGKSEFKNLDAAVWGSELTSNDNVTLEGVEFVSAGVHFSYDNALYVKFSAKGVTDDNFRVVVKDASENVKGEYKLSDATLIDAEKSVYYLRLNPLSALDFNEFYYISLCSYADGAASAKYTLKYSIASYVCAKQNANNGPEIEEDELPPLGEISGDAYLTAMANLARAVYNYGLSAQDYDTYKDEISPDEDELPILSAENFKGAATLLTQAVGEGISINEIANLNLDVDELDSHAGEEENSWLMDNFRETNTLSVGRLKSIRLKKLADGTYMVIYMGDIKKSGYLTKGIIYRTSTDLKTWSDEKFLFEDNDKAVVHNSPDAIVLSNGDIIAAAFVANMNAYPNQNDDIYGDAADFSIQIKRSTDNGATWSAAKVIYQGMAWEPSFIEYKDPTTGETQLQCYYTNSAPFMHRYGYFNNVRSTGSAVIRSTNYDEVDDINDMTWFINARKNSPSATDVPTKGETGYSATYFDGHIISQTSIGNPNNVYDGSDPVTAFNDQMPVGVQLHNGSIAVVMECYKYDDGHHSCDGKGYRHYLTAVALSNDNWSRSLRFDQEGPSSDYKYYIDHAEDGHFEKTLMGPYIAQFDSGEVMMTMHGADDTYKTSLFQYMADSTGYNPKYVNSPLAGEIRVKTWSSIVMASSHCMVTATADHLTSHDLSSDMEWLNTWHPSAGSSDEDAKQSIVDALANGDPGNRLVTVRSYLNHRIDANEFTMTVDGDNADWANNTDALFVGAKSQAQAAIRAANDSDNIYFLVERLDNNLSASGDETVLTFTVDGTTQYRITVSPNAEYTFEKISGGKSTVKATDIDVAVTVVGSVDGTENDEGYVVEISIKKSALGASFDTMYFDATLNNTDGAVSITESMFAYAPADITKRGKIAIK